MSLTPSLRQILAMGMALRVVVWLFLSPFNNDDHYSVIRLILERRALPGSEMSGQAFHPPLYYVLAVPWALAGSAKWVQGLSLALSLLNLWAIYVLIKGEGVLETDTARRHALLFAVILPQFVIFGNFVSNDSLAFLLGTALMLQVKRCLQEGSLRNMLCLAGVLGLGLLAKGTFVGYVAPCAGVVFGVSGERRRALSRRIASVGLFVLVVGAVGSYKYVENAVRLGRPLVTIMDSGAPWVRAQQGTYRGLDTIVDVDIWKLVREPYLTDRWVHSYPLLLYATFWHSYIRESNFVVTRNRVPALARAIYVAGVVPTVIIATGMAVALWGAVRVIRRRGWRGRWFTLEMFPAVCVLLFLANFGVVMAVGVKYDAWSNFQARLLFPSFAVVSLALGWGVDSSCRAGMRRALLMGPLIMTYVLFACYFAVEIGAIVIRTLR